MFTSEYFCTNYIICHTKLDYDKKLMKVGLLGNGLAYKSNYIIIANKKILVNIQQNRALSWSWPIIDNLGAFMYLRAEFALSIVAVSY